MLQKDSEIKSYENIYTNYSNILLILFVILMLIYFIVIYFKIN
jgi:hypothetical protein